MCGVTSTLYSVCWNEQRSQRHNDEYRRWWLWPCIKGCLYVRYLHELTIINRHFTHLPIYPPTHLLTYPDKYLYGPTYTVHTYMYAFQFNVGGRYPFGVRDIDLEDWRMARFACLLADLMIMLFLRSIRTSAVLLLGNIIGRREEKGMKKNGE